MPQQNEGAVSAWRSAPAPASDVRRAWQSGDQQQNHGRESTPWGARITVALLAGTFALLAGLFLYELILVPIKTPVVTAIALDYRWPLAPNAWAREDVDGLKENLGEQTLAVREINLGGAAAAEVLTTLARQIEQGVREAPPAGTVVVYLSAHGAVDEKGNLCLLPANADPVDAGSWLRLTDILERIKAIPGRPDVHFLLVLDSNRQDENWGIGLLQNTFAERLVSTVAQAAVPRLAVINSTSAGEIGWASSRIRCSVFGHFLELGLAGAADENGDGRVSLRELHGYLVKNVDGWARQHRAARQTPQLCASDADDFQITWSLAPRDLARLTAAPLPDDSRDSVAAAAKLVEPWRLYAELAAHHPQHYAAWKWQEVEHDLLWLEAAAAAGNAYKPAFDMTLRRVSAELNQARDAVGTGSFAPAKFAAAIASDDTIPLPDLKAYSRSLAEYLGIAAGRPVERFSENHFAGLVDHYRVDKLWPDFDVKTKSLGLYDLSERRAVPHGDDKVADDLRAHALVRLSLDQCDRDRRLAEDGVFLGPIQAPGLAKQLEACRQRYEHVGALELALAQAYQARDRAWAELPYLARWVSWQEESAENSPHSPLPNSPGQQGADKQSTDKQNVDKQAAPKSADAQRAAARSQDRLLALVDIANRLDAVLRDAEKSVGRPGNPTAAIDAQTPRAEALARELLEILDSYRAAILDSARKLPVAQPGPQTLRQMEVVLATPLVSGAGRTDLLSKYFEMQAAEDANGTQPANPDAKPDQGSKAEQVLSTAAQWMTHPVAALLSAGDKGQISSNDHDRAALGEKLRLMLRHAASLPAGDAALDLFESERGVRRVVAMESDLGSSPTRKLSRRHLQDLLLWHCGRVLDDFWGALAAGHEPFFAEAGEGYLVGARLLLPPDAPVEQKMQALQALWEARRNAAFRGLLTTATDLVLIDAQSTATAQVSIRANAEAAGLPAGVAAIYLRDNVVPIPQTLRRLEVGPELADRRSAAHDVTVAVDARELAENGAMRTAVLQAVAMFRGNEFPAPLMPREVAGRRIEIQRHQYGVSHVTVRGDRVKHASLVFILDCSHSMEDPVPVEGPDAPGRVGHRSKLNVAVDALEGMLQRLGEQGDVRVGVRFFGHRVGWRTDKPDSLARQEAYPGGVPPTLRPYEDVELFLPLGRFDSVTAGGVIRRLHALKPWGESPIFLSLVEALKDFGPEDAHSDQRVVVITDGMNYQFNPPPESAPQLKEVQEAYARRGVSVDVVGFGIPAEERLTAVKDFTQLAETTRGSFTLASNASALVRRLEQLLVKTQFSVTDDTGRALQSAELGGTVAVEASPAMPLDCEIDVDNLRARTRLVGGEALQLAVSREGRRVLCLPYEDDSPVFAPLVTAEPTSPTGLRVGVHRARRESDGVVFPISFQRDDQAIPQRPAQIWIEIAPLVQGRPPADNGYLFYDANYEPDMPVPVMRCRCLNWPKEADQAAVRVWCAERPVDPDEVVPLARVADQTPPAGEGFELKSMPGVRYQVRTTPLPGGRTQVRIVERHRPDVPIHALKVELFPPPRHIVHQFDAEHGIVLHTMELDAAAGKSEPAAELRFTARSHFTEAVWRIEQPVNVGIPLHSEIVLPPRILGSSAP
jgi:hypothetical protein